MNEFTLLEDAIKPVWYAMWEDVTSDAQDIRCYQPPEGFDATAELTDRHPETGEELDYSEWVIYLTPTE